MTWDYRILRHKKGKDVWFELHEVFYERGKVTGYTKEGFAHSESVKELQATLLMMLLDSRKRRKMLDYEE